MARTGYMYMTRSGYTWQQMSINGQNWLYMVITGYTWPELAIHTWPELAIHSKNCLYMGKTAYTELYILDRAMSVHKHRTTE